MPQLRCKPGFSRPVGNESIPDGTFPIVRKDEISESEYDEAPRPVSRMRSLADLTTDVGKKVNGAVRKMPSAAILTKRGSKVYDRSDSGANPEVYTQENSEEGETEKLRYLGAAYESMPERTPPMAVDTMRTLRVPSPYSFPQDEVDECDDDVSSLKSEKTVKPGKRQSRWSMCTTAKDQETLEADEEPAGKRFTPKFSHQLSKMATFGSLHTAFLMGNEQGKSSSAVDEEPVSPRTSQVKNKAETKRSHGLARRLSRMSTFDGLRTAFLSGHGSERTTTTSISQDDHDVLGPKTTDANYDALRAKEVEQATRDRQVEETKRRCDEAVKHAAEPCDFEGAVQGAAERLIGEPMLSNGKFLPAIEQGLLVAQEARKDSLERQTERHKTLDALTEAAGLHGDKAETSSIQPEPSHGLDSLHELVDAVNALEMLDEVGKTVGRSTVKQALTTRMTPLLESPLSVEKTLPYTSGLVSKPKQSFYERQYADVPNEDGGVFDKQLDVLSIVKMLEPHRRWAGWVCDEALGDVGKRWDTIAKEQTAVREKGWEDLGEGRAETGTREE